MNKYILTLVLMLAAGIVVVAAGCQTQLTDGNFTDNTTNNTNNTNSTGNLTNTTNDSITVIEFQTYGGFTPPDAEKQVLVLTADKATYTLYHRDGSVTRSYEKDIDREDFDRLVETYDSNGFFTLDDMYKNPENVAIADAGVGQIKYTKGTLSKTILMDPYAPEYYPDEVREIFEETQEMLNDVTDAGPNDQTGNDDAGLIGMTYQPIQCENTTWQEWYAEGNVQFVTEPSEKELALAYFSAKGVDVLDFTKVESGNNVCLACGICATSYHYTATVPADNVSTMQSLGWNVTNSTQ